MDLRFASVTGRLVHDPELRLTTSQRKVCNFLFACHYTKDKTLFINGVAWGAMAEYISTYAHKGDRVLVNGDFEFNEYTDSLGEQKKNIVIRVDTLILIRKNETATVLKADAEDLTVNSMIGDEDDYDLPY